MDIDNKIEKFIKGVPFTERSAFSSQDTVEFRIQVPKSTVRATMEILSDETGKRKRFSMCIMHNKNGTHVYNYPLNGCIPGAIM